MSEEMKMNLYEYEIGRFQELIHQDRGYALQRYGWTLFYSLPPEEIYRLKNEFGWKGEEALDCYNRGVMICDEGKYSEALKLFEKAETMKCVIPELFYNMAYIYELNENKDKAREYYQKYIDTCEKLDEIPIKLQRDLDEVREHIKTLL